MAGSHKLFSLPELVENIVVQLSPPKVWEVQLVSRLWRDLINRNTSKRMNIAKCAKPDKAEIVNIDFHSYGGIPSECLPWHISAPKYSVGTKLQFHKVIGREEPSILPDAALSVIEFDILNWDHDYDQDGGDWNEETVSVEQLSPHRQDFLTMPPCEAVGLKVEASNFDEDLFLAVSCVVYAAEGVTIGHLLDAHADVCAGISGFDTFNEGRSSCFVAQRINASEVATYLTWLAKRREKSVQ